METPSLCGWVSEECRDGALQRIGGQKGLQLPRSGACRAAVPLAEYIGMERIEKRHRQMADYVLEGNGRARAESWSRRDAALRCAIGRVKWRRYTFRTNRKLDVETKSIRLRGGGRPKDSLSTPYYLLRKGPRQIWRLSMSTRKGSRSLKTREDQRFSNQLKGKRSAKFAVEASLVPDRVSRGKACRPSRNISCRLSTGIGLPISVALGRHSAVASGIIEFILMVLAAAVASIRQIALPVLRARSGGYGIAFALLFRRQASRPITTASCMPR